MSRTWKDMAAVEARRLENLRKALREGIAREKARNEVLLALTTGQLKAKQVKGNEYVGKAGTMHRSVRFDLEQLISLRAADLASRS
jgi:hypothetical protein